MGIIPIQSGATTSKAGSFLMASIGGFVKVWHILSKSLHIISEYHIIFMCNLWIIVVLS
jgi:hypothetical protein